MSLVGFTFGSFGDIITIISLAWSIKQLLSDANGAPAECRLLVEYLDTFTNTVEIVKTLAVDANDASASASSDVIPSPLSRPEYRMAVNVVSHALSICRSLLEKFKSKLAPYETSLLSNNACSKLVVFRRKLSWISIRKEALELRRNLEGQLHSINIILSVVALHIPQHVHRSLPAGVWLTDILNTKAFVPTEWSKNLMDFHKYLLFYFKEQNRKGTAFVQRREYTLETDGSRELISPGTWAGHTQPGGHVLMNAMVARESTADPYICPNCQTKNCMGIVDFGCEIQCCSCGTIFKKVKLPESDKNESLALARYHLGVEDLPFIRRISFITEPDEDSDTVVKELLAAGWARGGRWANSSAYPAASHSSVFINASSKRPTGSI